VVVFSLYPIKPEIFWGVLGVVLGGIALIYAILHHMDFKRLQNRMVISPLSKAFGLMAEGKWSEAVSEFKQAMKKAEAGYSVNFCNLIGLCHFENGEIDLALESYDLSRSLAKELNDKKGEAIACNHLGLIFKHRGEKKKALRYYQDAVGLFTQIGSQMGIENTRRNIQELKNK
jgi:tetratricopeptide (TPR) repeat protein